MFTTLGTAFLTAESLKTMTDNFMTVVGANLPLLLGVAGTMFGLNWVLRRINKAKRGSL